LPAIDVGHKGMNPTHWRRFLKQYSEEFLSHDWSDTIFSSRGAVIPDEARRSGYMGFGPASEAAISAAEDRLGRRLPPSLRAFYEVSNGWGMTGPFIFDVLPVEKIGWLKERTGEDDALLYRMACENEDPPKDKPRAPWRNDPDGARERAYRFEQGTRLKRSLVISSWGDAAVWILDPGDHDHEGEWAGGRWASWSPGLEWRAESFAELMKQERESLPDEPA
jgi:hypothetical protein